jgi:hypothetical protein
MKAPSPYSYRLLLENKQVGPFDRRTIVGMRINKLIPKETSVLRSDGLLMSAAQLLADRNEQADPQTGHLASAPMTAASVLWPTFLVNFGGNFWGLLGAGALGFVGQGELRFQSDALRLRGQRKSGLFGSAEDRIKMPLADIAAVDAQGSTVRITLSANHRLVAQLKSPIVKLRMDSPGSVAELIELVRASV